MPRTTSSRHVLLVVSATACWGVGTVLSKQVLDRGVAPLTLLVIELAASTLLLGLGALVLGARPTRSPELGRLALLGVLNPGVAYALGLLGLASITASLSVLLWATEPVLIMLLAVLILRERVAAATMVGVAVALAGVALVLYRPGAYGDATGIGLTTAAVCACAVYAVLTRRLLLDDGSLEVVLVQQVAALCFALAVVADGQFRGSVQSRVTGRPGNVGARGHVRHRLLRLRLLVLRRRGARRTGLCCWEPVPADPGLRARGCVRRRRSPERPSVGRGGDSRHRDRCGRDPSPHPGRRRLITMSARVERAEGGG